MDEQNIIIQDDIIKVVVDRLSKLRDGQEKYNGIILWAKDISVKDVVRKQDFIDRLSTDLDNHDLRSYGKIIRVLSDEPKNESETLDLDTIYGKLKICRVLLRVQITAMNGTMEESEYILDWSQQTQWNIGRGKQPSNRYGVDVENYIVIKNDEKDDDIRYVNEHVSSYHAKIVYDNEGFYLHAEEGGLGHTRLKHKNSKEWYTLRTEIGVPLCDGDYVKLGSVEHYILLRFKLN